MSGYLHIDDLHMPIEQMEIERQDPRPIQGFVERNGPTAIKEIQQVYDLSEKNALQKLADAKGVTSAVYGEAELWIRE